MFLVSDAGTVKGSKSRHNLLVRRQECVLLPSLLLFLSLLVLLQHRILRHSYGISLYLELAREHSIQHSIQCSTLRLIRYSIRHSIPRIIGRVYPYSTLYYEPSPSTRLPCNGIPSFFSYTTRASTKTNTSRILLFNTRRVQTSKRSNLEA